MAARTTVHAAGRPSPRDGDGLAHVRDAMDAVTSWIEATYVGDYVRDLAECLVLGTLCARNVLVLGVPGTAKSEMVRAFASCMGGEFFGLGLDPFTTPEDVFGQRDMAAFTASGAWVRDGTGMLTAAHFALLDEGGRAGEAVHAALFTAVNERVYRNGAVEQRLPLVCAVMTSNTALPDDTGAMRDRFPLAVVAAWVERAEEFAALLGTDARRTPPPPGVPLGDVLAAGAAVRRVVLTAATVDAATTLWRRLGADGVRLSNRRWVWAMDVVRAAAWLDSRAETAPADLASLVHVAWDTPEQRDAVRAVVFDVAVPQRRVLAEKAAVVDALATRLDALSAWGMSRKQRAGLAVDMTQELVDTVLAARDASTKASGPVRRDADRLVTRSIAVLAQVVLASGQVDTRAPDAAAQADQLARDMVARWTG